VLAGVEVLRLDLFELRRLTPDRKSPGSRDRGSHGWPLASVASEPSWRVGVRADPLVDGLDLGTYRGRLDADPYMEVPGAQGIYACGECAAVPDLTLPGQICGMTAQHATRQGKMVARNVAASLGGGMRTEYKYDDLGFLVDLGGLAARRGP
jgi:NADH:ubiquinone reductase (H+-translocating)